MKQVLAIFSYTFWKQSLATLRHFLYGNVRAIRSLGRRGSGTDIPPSVRMGYPANIFLGDGSGIGHHCHIYAGADSSVNIGNGTLIGSQVFITSDSFGASKDDLLSAHSGHTGDVIIGHNVRIGAHAVILPGVSIGDGAAVGAGSVVTANVEAGSVVAGNPARVISPRK